MPGPDEVRQLGAVAPGFGGEGGRHSRTLRGVLPRAGATPGAAPGRSRPPAGPGPPARPASEAILDRHAARGTRHAARSTRHPGTWHPALRHPVVGRAHGVQPGRAFPCTAWMSISTLSFVPIAEIPAWMTWL
ncbi:hypothetical protein Sdia_09070 [Streptomyces diastaticus subsp. diastaticus]|uniref:Uncharacterized protein n=1 Tax=Streptomyces diastaticus subsp. diastaticus TaxID=68040 RepID=A0ABQ1CI73_STRDI|nr:hypothetical protein Sdia_09070 [Streptomyces diastaticus subsp. diastaticus]GGU15383.1 hypothetical protein GCM10015534_17530 [Streptomyces diastaticus subsp. diastaticus]